MKSIIEKFKQEKQYGLLEKAIEKTFSLKKNLPYCITGLCDDARNICAISLISYVKENYSRRSVIIVHDDQTAQKLTAELNSFGLFAIHFCERDYNFYGVSSSKEFEIKRLCALKSYVDKSCDVLVCSAMGALQFILPRKNFVSSVINIDMSGEYDIDDLCNRLTFIGYQRCELVDCVGQFAVRGGIFDIFPLGYDKPVRIEFYGDEVDSISYYDIDTQRRGDALERIDIIPAGETLIDADVKNSIEKELTKLIAACDDDNTAQSLARQKDALSSGEFHCADRYVSLIYKTPFLDYIREDDLVFCFSDDLITRSVDAAHKHLALTVESMLEQGIVNGKNAVYYKDKADLDVFLRSRPTLYFDTLGASQTGARLDGLFDFTSKQTVSYSDKSSLMIEDISDYVNMGYSVDIVCQNKASSDNLFELLRENNIDTGKIRITHGIAIGGFELPLSKYVCISESGKSRVSIKRRRSADAKLSKGERILSYADLKVGDYVVHANHGIGIYAGIQTLTFEGVTRDFIKIQYAGKDAIYLPCNQLDMLSKYIGAHSEDGTLKLSRLGGAEWGKTKKRVKSAAKEMAKELTALYAKRTRLPGFAFGGDDEFQREFEASFEYEETDGQKTASDEIKRDMEKPYPMDRLLCGDVGFGKTEVAMRAAFKAAMNNKQVAVLVPTTILAMQHYRVFSSRMKEFPINVDLICRFNSPTQQKKSLMRLKRGETDIIIGTHRLLSKDIAFRDLGLVIIDEEQRFGVAHKEKLKQVSQNVDVLTLSATPIPRTLNMAMSGIRDMSILEEAPGDRYPVQSYVLEYDDAIISEAINKELIRGGQVFYLCNDIERIDGVAAHLQRFFPDARIAGAHGRMDRDELSEIWRALVDGEIDIIVCTTIIESGVDVPRANTLIIENADRFGLSQLHQIRGRVGRSGRRAYAYFTVPKGRTVNEIAVKRLQALREYTEFGSGFRIALRDLEIRGAGNVLGAEQHGHMDSVGYDLYIRILNEAIIEEQGGVLEEKTECTVDYAKSAYIPESYISSSAQRIDAYKKVSLIDSFESMRDVLDELIDRYGDAPKSVETLLNISLIRYLGCKLKLEKIVIAKGSVTLYNTTDDFAKIEKSAEECKVKTLKKKSMKPQLILKVNSGSELRMTQNILSSCVGI